MLNLHLHYLTPSDLAKDLILATLGLTLGAITQIDVSLILGLLNLLLVFAFRLIELRRRDQTRQLRARISELEGNRDATARED